MCSLFLETRRWYVYRDSVKKGFMICIGSIMCCSGVHGNGSFAMYRQGCCESSFSLGCSWCWFNVQWSSWGEDNLLPNRTLSEVVDWDIGELPGWYVHSDPSLNWVFLYRWSQAKMQYLMIRANVLSPFASHGSVSGANVGSWWRGGNVVIETSLSYILLLMVTEQLRDSHFPSYY